MSRLIPHQKIERNFIKTRNYEVDFRKVLSPAMPYRYLESTKWGSINALGKKTSGETTTPINIALAEHGINVPLKINRSKVFHHLGANETLLIESSVSKVGKSSCILSTMAYRVSPTDENHKILVYIGDVVMVAMNSEGKAVPVPQNAREIFEANLTEKDVSFDDIKPHMKSFPASINATILKENNIFGYEYDVRASDLDILNHVNQSKYMDFYDDCRIRAARSGFFKDLVPHMSSQEIEYLSHTDATIEFVDQTRLGDKIVVLSRYEVVDKKSLRGIYQMRNVDDKRILSQGMVLWSKSIPLPPDTADVKAKL